MLKRNKTIKDIREITIRTDGNRYTLIFRSSRGNVTIELTDNAYLTLLNTIVEINRN